METVKKLNNEQQSLLFQQETWKELEKLARPYPIESMGVRLDCWTTEGEIHFRYEEKEPNFIVKNKYPFYGSDESMLLSWDKFYQSVLNYRPQIGSIGELQEKKVKDLNFGEAVEYLKQGYPVQRQGWNGKGLFVFMQVPANIDVGTVVPKMQSLPLKVKDVFMDRLENGRTSSKLIDPIEFNTLKYQNQLAMVYPDNHIYGWLASPSDCLANDWQVYSI